MAKKSIMAKVGVWAYVAGIVLALVFGLIALLGGSSSLPLWVVIVLAVLGVIVGLLNIGDGEVMLFLLAAIAFVVAATSLGSIFAALGMNFLNVIANAIVIFTAPGALVVAFKALYGVASDN